MPPNPRVSTEVWFLNNWGFVDISETVTNRGHAALGFGVHDDFNDASLASELWSIDFPSTGGTVGESGGAITFSMNASDPEDFFAQLNYKANTYGRPWLGDGSVTIDVTDWGDNTVDQNIEFMVSLGTLPDIAMCAWIYRNEGGDPGLFSFYNDDVAGDSEVEELASPTRYLRIRVASRVVYWETSSDGSSWTTQRTESIQDPDVTSELRTTYFSVYRPASGTTDTVTLNEVTIDAWLALEEEVQAGGETDDLTNEATNTPSLTSAEAGSEGGSGSGSQFLGEATAETLTNEATNTPNLDVLDADAGGSTGTGSQSVAESVSESVLNSAANTPNLDVLDVDTGGSTGSGSQNLAEATAETATNSGTGAQSFALDATAEAQTNSAESTQTLGELELLIVEDILRNFGGQHTLFESFDAPLDYDDTWSGTDEFSVAGGKLIFNLEERSNGGSYLLYNKWDPFDNDTHLANNPPFRLGQEVILEIGAHTLDDGPDSYFEFGLYSPYLVFGYTRLASAPEAEGLWAIGDNTFIQATLPSFLKIAAEETEDVLYVKDDVNDAWSEVYRWSRAHEEPRAITIYGEQVGGGEVEIESIEVREIGDETHVIEEQIGYADVLRNFGGQHTFREEFDAPLDYDEWEHTEEFAVSGGALIFTNVFGGGASYLQRSNWNPTSNDTHLTNNPPFSVGQEAIVQIGNGVFNPDVYFELGVDGGSNTYAGLFYGYDFIEDDFGLVAATSNEQLYIQPTVPDFFKIAAEVTEDVFYIKNIGDADWTEVFRATRGRSDNARDVYLWLGSNDSAEVEILSFEVRQIGDETHEISSAEAGSEENAGGADQGQAEATAESVVNSQIVTPVLDEDIQTLNLEEEFDHVGTNIPSLYDQVDGALSETADVVCSATHSLGEQISGGVEEPTPGGSVGDVGVYGGGPLIPITQQRESIVEDIFCQSIGEHVLVELEREIHFVDRVVEKIVDRPVYVTGISKKSGVDRVEEFGDGGHIEEVSVGGVKLKALDVSGLRQEIVLQERARARKVFDHNLRVIHHTMMLNSEDD